MKSLQDFSSLGINPENLSFSVNRNLKQEQEKDQELLLDDISFESININDEINYIPKIFDVSNQNQKIILDIEINETGIGLGGNNFMPKEFNSLQGLYSFLGDSRNDFAIENGAKGGKLLGAGSGGFLLFFCDSVLNKNKLQSKFSESEIVNFEISKSGSEIILNDKCEKNELL